MNDFDPFKEQKEQSLKQSMSAIYNLAVHLSSIVQTSNSSTNQQNFIDLLQVLNCNNFSFFKL